jgi:hypothetical protein
VGVFVGVAVGVAEGVLLAVAVAVGVNVAVGVGVFSPGCCQLTRSTTSPFAVFAVYEQTSSNFVAALPTSTGTI